MTGRPLQVLVIGAGPAAERLHLPVLAGLRDKGEIALALVCDIQEERAASARRKFGFQQHNGDAVAAMERPDIDAVYIFGSAQLHYEYGLRALQNAKHLFVEKPIAPSFAQACEMAEVANSLGVIAVGGHNRRFYKALGVARARAGKAGWRFAEATFHKPEIGNPPQFGANSWLGANGIHALDALVFMMGALPEQMTAFAAENTSGVPSAFSAVMRWRDGAQGVFLCNNDAGLRREEYAFHKPGETYRVTEKGLLVEKDGAVSKPKFPSIEDGFEAEHQAFLKAIRGNRQPRHSIGALAPSLFLAELIESGFSGRVELPKPEQRDIPTLRERAMAVLVVEPAGLQPALARLLPHHSLISLGDVRASANPRLDVTAAILGRGSAALPADILDRLPRLAIVGVMGLSLARYEPEALLARGIALVNASAAYAETVAEFALGLAILGRRRAFISHEIMLRGGWGADLRMQGLKGTARKGVRNLRPTLKAAGLEPFFQYIWRKALPLVEAPRGGRTAPRDLRGATVGLIGWGANARAFAERLIPAGARVAVYSEHAAESDITDGGATPASLGEVLAADIVSLHRGLSEHTRHCLGVAELARLRPGAVLINVARGELIEPNALLARLRHGDIFACLDTFEDEPLAASHPLRRLQNVFLTSHIAGGSSDMHAAAAEEVVRKVLTYLQGDAIASISAEHLRTMT